MLNYWNLKVVNQEEKFHQAFKIVARMIMEGKIQKRSDIKDALLKVLPFGSLAPALTGPKIKYLGQFYSLCEDIQQDFWQQKRIQPKNLERLKKIDLMAIEEVIGGYGEIRLGDLEEENLSILKYRNMLFDRSEISSRSVVVLSPVKEFKSKVRQIGLYEDARDQLIQMTLRSFLLKKIYQHAFEKAFQKSEQITQKYNLLMTRQGKPRETNPFDKRSIPSPEDLTAWEEIKQTEWSKLIFMDIQCRQITLKNNVNHPREKFRKEFMEEGFYSKDVVNKVLDYYYPETKVILADEQKLTDEYEQHQGFLNGLSLEYVNLLRRIQGKFSDSKRSSLFNKDGSFNTLRNSLKEGYEKFNSILEHYLQENSQDQEWLKEESVRRELFFSLTQYADKQDLLKFAEAILTLRSEAEDDAFVQKNFPGENIQNIRSKIHHLTPQAFVHSQSGRNNSVHRLNVSLSKNHPIVLRIEHNPIEREIQRKGMNRKGWAQVPINSYSEQFKIHQRLYAHFEKLRVEGVNAPHVPKPILSGSSFMFLEDVALPAAYDVFNHPDTKNILVQGSTAVQKINYDEQLNVLFDEFKKIYFKHCDLHHRNILINPKTGDIYLIDFDYSKFFSNEKEFKEYLGVYVNGRLIPIERDEKDWKQE